MHASLYGLSTDIMILAQEAGGGAGAGGGVDTQKIQSTPIWGLLQNVLAAFGVILVLVGLAKIAMKLLSGNPTGAFKGAGAILIAGALMFNISFVFDLLTGGQGVIGKVVDSVVSIIS